MVCRVLAAAGLFCLLCVSSASAQRHDILEVPVRDNMRRLLACEDTNGDRLITVDDRGPRRFHVRSLDGRPYLVEGTYRLSNLLQELAVARAGDSPAKLKGARIHQPPANRLQWMIRSRYWDQLTRRLDEGGVLQAATDPKISAHGSLRIYVPHGDKAALRYYRRLAGRTGSSRLRVVRLPSKITPDYVRELNDRPGILSLAMSGNGKGRGKPRPLPFVVPGGRFNELYGWDSYFIALGLLEHGRVHRARWMVDHLVYEIRHYGRILNANRTYYLTRSQPPFLTSMALAVYRELPRNRGSRRWLAGVIRAAIIEYETVWMDDEHLTPTGLSRYWGRGIGIPPETEPSHYDAVLKPRAAERGLGVEAFTSKYQRGEIEDPALDRFFRHDRAMRESGHDTTYRLLGRAANLNPVALNALLYKYESDIASVIEEQFADELPLQAVLHTAEAWRARAARRRRLMDRYLWNPRRGAYYDYDFVRQRQVEYVSATSLYPLWAGCASREQARRLVARTLPELVEAGGIVASSRASRGPLSVERPQRQWDYPFGWAPHQMIAWQGLQHYGYGEKARRLAYRWLYMIAMNAKRYNGAIVEKYDVVHRTLKASAEYGNVGTRFEYVPRGGFAWTNASFAVGRRLLSPRQNRDLLRLISPEWKSEGEHAASPAQNDDSHEDRIQGPPRGQRSSSRSSGMGLP